ncbi:MAG: DUF502 domain-containing protein [Nitrospirae bacterium]|nr:DUF502 domain-containing protein [Nitrospirota bacterium]
MKGQLKRYFITGLLVITPIWGTYLVLSTLLRFLEGFLGDSLKGIGKYYIPGMGIITLVILIFLVGVLTTNFIGKKVMNLSERAMNRVPLVRSIYTVFKHIVDTLSLQGKEHFNRVVIVEFPRDGVYSLGFITGVTRGEVQNLTTETVVNVFIPTTPNPTTGYFIFVPENKVTPLSMGVEDAMKMLISGGLYTPPHLKDAKQHKGPEGFSSTKAGDSKEAGVKV